MRIDLHIHSNLSDGDDSVLELVSKIKREKIDLFAITDHDSVKSIDILNDISNISYIPGVEMSSALKNVKMHILGYGICSNGNIRKKCYDIANKRRNITLEILEDLKKKGYYFNEEYLERFNKDDGLILSKVDISKLLVKCGYANEIKDAFYGILKPYSVGSQIRQDAEEIISSIREDNGISILAHPGEIVKKQNVDITRVIDELCEIGIDGIEVCTPKHSSIEQHEFLNIAKERNMLITGGSDYHGCFTKPNITLCDGVNGDLISERVKKKCIKH